MLYLIGLGLDKKDLSLNALEAIKKCKKIYFENYTNVMPYSIKDFEKVIKRKIAIADRKFVEENEKLIEESKKENVALLVSGDPLSATTHIELIMRAKKKNLKFKILHAPTVFSVIAETGLQLYKFGKTASIAKWQHNFNPESFYDLIKQNLAAGSHTLLLLDIGLPVKEALGYIESIAKARDLEMLDKEFIICEKLGTEKQKITIGKIFDISQRRFSLPACIILPGKLHFLETEMLQMIKNDM
ncbi:MAG: diphthine synthase [Nanoarchaeota archaeon]|nr:diphthine synthase [Nanoarchaeota archaeon]